MKEDFYYFVRLMHVLIFAFALYAAFLAPEIDPIEGGRALLVDVAIVVLGLYVVLPNRFFLSERLCKLRLLSFCLMAVFPASYGVIFLAKWFQQLTFMIGMMGIGAILSGLSLPISILLKKSLRKYPG